MVLSRLDTSCSLRLWQTGDTRYSCRSWRISCTCEGFGQIFYDQLWTEGYEAPLLASLKSAVILTSASGPLNLGVITKGLAWTIRSPGSVQLMIPSFTKFSNFFHPFHLF